MTAELVQIIYDDDIMTAEQRAKDCFPFARLYKNETLTIFFENSVIAEEVLMTKADKIAVCSWELKNKLRWNPFKQRELTQEILESDYEILSFTRNTQNHRMLRAADAWHPGFIEIFDRILSMIGVRRTMELKVPIYQNHFSAKLHIYRDYVNKYLLPVMDIISNNKEINALAMHDANYTKLKRGKSGNLQKYLGIDYYPLSPFILERLFSVYVQNHNIPVTYL